ncbi:hypothetical protein HBI91_012480 [Parastagonospora nodorum]|nr:hypothetical protein HBI97_070650 [Parastagonospora nodorum]KAH5882842.1 hypothetical protein HBI91_012480 [Parastagonospora nodorum]
MGLITIDRTSPVIDTLTVTPIKDDDNLLNTINSHIKLRKLKEVMLLCWIIKSLSIPSADKYSKKHLEVREADVLKQVGANVREGGNKNRSSLYYSDKLEAQLRKASEEEELAKTKKEKREKEAREREAGLDSLLDSDDYRSDSSSDIDSKDDSEDEEATIAKDLAREQKERLKALLNAKMRDSLSARDTFTLRTRRKCEMPEQKGLILRRRTSTSSYNDDWLELAIDPANSTLCDLSDLLVVRFCIFSNPALENIGIPTNKEVVEMQTNTATALADELAAVNKLVRLQTFTLKILEHANMPAVHSKATKHRLALSAARFALVCGFGKVDRHVFRADNTMSDTNGKHGLCLERGSAVDKVTGKHTYKTCNRVYALTAKTLSP